MAMGALGEGFEEAVGLNRTQDREIFTGFLCGRPPNHKNTPKRKEPAPARDPGTRTHVWYRPDSAALRGLD